MKYEPEGNNRVTATTETEAGALAKIQRILKNADEMPNPRDYLTEKELKGLNDQDLLEQYTLMYCAKDLDAPFSFGTLFPWFGDIDDNIARAKSEPSEATSVDEYYAMILAECESRGYSASQLETDAKKNINAAREANIADLTGMSLNVHMLALQNSTTERLLYKYMTLTPFERETTARFKSELTTETQGVSAGNRWDEKGQTMNAGTAYEVKVTQNKDGSYHCESDYLGTFDYDPKVFAIGYKDVPGEDTLKLPVLKCLPDAQAQGNAYGLSLSWNAARGKSVGLSGYDNSIVPARDDRSGTGQSQEVVIPDGVKSIDYTFEGLDNLNFIPYLPDSIESAHCAFKDCVNLYQESNLALDHPVVDFGDHSKMHWPPNLEDMSSMFSGCKSMHDLKFCDFPSEVVTIDNMFDGCSQLFDGFEVKGPMSFLPWAGRTDGILAGTILSTENEINWSECPYLMEEFAYCINSETSNTFKAVAEREEKERKEFQLEFGKPENLAKQTEEVQEKYADAKAADAVVRTEKVYNSDMTVRSLDEVSYNEPKENKWAALIQRGVIDLASFGVLKGVTKIATKSELASWAVGLGGTAALRLTNILPRSFEPALQLIKKWLPESAQGPLNKFIDWIHIPTEEDIAAAKAEQFGRYKDLALEDSMERSAWSAGVFYEDDTVRDALRTNGKAVAEYGVLQRCGEDGRESTTVVNDTISVALSQAEQVFSHQKAADARGKGDGYDWDEEMRKYYYQMLYGLEGYSEGAMEGIAEAYSSEEALKDKDNAAHKAHAQTGLAYVNCEYASTVLESLKKMDDKYHFMTVEDWVRLDALNIYGVPALSTYKGQALQPVGVAIAAPIVQPGAEAPVAETTAPAPVQVTPAAEAASNHDRYVAQAEAMSASVEVPPEETPVYGGSYGASR